MSNQPDKPNEQEKVSAEAFAQEMTRSRDKTTQTVTYAILAAGGVIIASALGFAGFGNEAAYAQVKDVLLFVNPFLGLVIGYYFQKAASDARAQNAETMANVATTAKQEAQLDLQTAEKRLSDTRDSLEELAEATRDSVGSDVMTKELPGEPGGTLLTSPESSRLGKALARAETLLKAR